MKGKQMNNKIKVAVVAAIISGSTAFADNGNFELEGNIQTQATKALYDNSKDDNLDDFWFRANFSGSYKSESFDAKVTIRMYAPNFNGGADRFQADAYWANYKWASQGLNLKLGHWKTDTEGGGNFGAYLDKNISKRGFLARDYAHDAFEFGWKAGPSQLGFMVGVNDGKFNKGYLRITDKFKLSDAFSLGIGYRVNAFDPIQYTAVLTHKAVLNAKYNFAKQLALYGEVGAIITGKDDDVNDANIESGKALKPEYKKDTKYFPFYAGLEFPTGGIFDKAFVEFEYIADRKELNADAASAAWAVGIVKKVGSRTKIQLSAYSETDLSDVGLSARVTTTIK